MAKCIKCGRKGLFFKVNGEGLCASCAEIEAQRKALDEKQQKLEEEIRLHAALQEQLADAEKKLQTAQNRILKCKSTFQSMQHAMEIYMNPRADKSEIVPLLKVDLAEILGEEPELKCLTMKSLRSLYRQNEKQILQVTEAYQSQYTTKANAAIYKLMVLALHAELTVIMQGLSYGKLDDVVNKVKAITARYYTIAADGNQTIVNTLNRFIGQIEGLYIEAVKIEYEYYVQRERAKEEQRAIREQMRQELKDLVASLGLTAVFVTHDQAETMSMSSHIAVLNAGTVEQYDTPEGIYHRPATRFVARFVGKSNWLSETELFRPEAASPEEKPGFRRFELPVTGEEYLGESYNVQLQYQDSTWTVHTRHKVPIGEPLSVYIDPTQIIVCKKEKAES